MWQIGGNMSINGISGMNAQNAAAYEGVKTNSKSGKSQDVKEDKSVQKEDKIYQSSMSDSERAALIEHLKTSNQAQVDSFKSMVSDMLTKQGKAFNNADDFWKMMASGDYTVDEAAAKEAEAAISEDGYWGVKQTSDRIFEFAKALSGGDSEKMDDMLSAFKKGFDEATKSWGKSLPDISHKTYDAVMEKFEQFKNEGSEDSNS
jgi:restriction endonuclease Mrr